MKKILFAILILAPSLARGQAATGRVPPDPQVNGYSLRDNTDCPYSSKQVLYNGQPQPNMGLICAFEILQVTGVIYIQGDNSEYYTQVSPTSPWTYWGANTPDRPTFTVPALPHTFTFAWRAYPTNTPESPASYTITLDNGNPISIPLTNCVSVDMTCSAFVAVNSVGMHNWAITASNLTGTSTPSSQQFTVAVQGGTVTPIKVARQRVSSPSVQPTSGAPDLRRTPLDGPQRPINTAPRVPGE